MNVNVNLFTPSGKWKYGGDVEISGEHPLWTEDFKQELVNNQDFVNDGVFAYYFVVVTHKDEWATSTEPGFFQHMFREGEFAGFTKNQTPSSQDSTVRFKLNGKQAQIQYNLVTWHDIVLMAYGYLPKQLSTVMYSTRDQSRCGLLGHNESLYIEPDMHVTCYFTD